MCTGHGGCEFLRLAVPGTQGLAEAGRSEVGRSFRPVSDPKDRAPRCAPRVGQSGSELLENLENSSEPAFPPGVGYEVKVAQAVTFGYNTALVSSGGRMLAMGKQ